MRNAITALAVCLATFALSACDDDDGDATTSNSTDRANDGGARMDAAADGEGTALTDEATSLDDGAPVDSDDGEGAQAADASATGSHTDDDAERDDPPDAGAEDSDVSDSMPDDAGGDDDDAGLAAPIAPYTSGSRLRALVHEAEPGTAMVRGFFDTELEQVCQFQSNAGGELRCFRAGFSLPLFSDQACTEPVVGAASPCSPFELGDVVQTIDPNGDRTCGPRSMYFRADAAFTPGTLYAKSLDDGTCSETTVNPGQPYYHAADVDWSMYVEGTLHQEVLDPDSELAVEYIDGEDGSSMQQDFVVAGETCTPTVFDEPDDQQRCVLGLSAIFNTYATATCDADPVTPVSTECASTPRALQLFETDENGCARSTGVYEAGEVTQGPLYAGTADSCSEQPAADGVSNVHLGAAISPESLPVFDDVSFGDGRLQARTIAFAERRSSSLQWVDTQLGVECQPTRFADGSFRCIPDVSFDTGRYFADAACTTPLFDRLGYCEDLPPFAIFTTTTYGFLPELGRCDFTVEEVRRLQPYDGPVFEQTPTCEEVELVGVQLLSDGGEMLAEEFAELPLITE